MREVALRLHRTQCNYLTKDPTGQFPAQHNHSQQSSLSYFCIIFFSTSSKKRGSVHLTCWQVNCFDGVYLCGAMWFVPCSEAFDVKDVKTNNIQQSHGSHGCYFCLYPPKITVMLIGRKIQ